ncbi:MAG: MgtC/SapB family protein [Candidatus Brocadiaceae bacterium]|nr:MgtC/SapB family protein [Candidatus Brocadiaceae bacterium]
MDWIASIAPFLRETVGPIGFDPVFRILLAAVLGGLIGLERERHGRAAGLRTHLLLCIGCTLAMLVSLQMPRLAAGYGSEGLVRADPGRMAAQVLSGIGFLGAGAIITMGRRIRGLTTAATIWVTAAIGLSLGCGYVFGAVVTFLVALFAQRTLAAWERGMVVRDRYARLRLHFGHSGDQIARIRQVLHTRGWELLEYDLDWKPQGTTYTLELRRTRPDEAEQVVRELTDALQAEALTRIVWR